MRKFPLSAVAAIVALLAAAGCSNSGAPAPEVTVTVTAPAAGSSQPQPPAPAARQNARQLVNDLAPGSSLAAKSARKLVAGPVMTSYITLQIIEAEAVEESGQGTSPGSVSATGAGSYQLCYAQGGGCQSFTAFQSDKSGKITGMSVDGQPVASRLATGPDDSGGGIKISDVGSYLHTSTGTVAITFRVRNISNHGLADSDPPFLPALVTPDSTLLQYDFQNSLMPGSLQPGQSAAVEAVFDTRTFTGKLVVRSNGGEFPLVSSKLTKP